MRDIFLQITKASISTWNSYRVGHTIVEQSRTVNVLNTPTGIRHCIHVYYMIELFDIFRSISYILYGILDTRNIDLSLWDLLMENQPDTRVPPVENPMHAAFEKYWEVSEIIPLGFMEDDVT